MRKTVVIVSTLDTKSDEVRFLRERIEQGGVTTVVVDAGVLSQPSQRQQRGLRSNLCKHGERQQEHPHTRNAKRDTGR
jgi:uncharacterized protein (UPF0261 family)